jgi:hypothetical protein
LPWRQPAFTAHPIFFIFPTRKTIQHKASCSGKL